MRVEVARLAPDWGAPPSAVDYCELAKSWVNEETANAAQLRRVDASQGRDILGQKGKRDCAGVLFSYYLPEELRPHSYRIRRDNPDLTADKVGKHKLAGKYLGAPGSSSRLYFPPGVTKKQLEDTSLPIVIVEGEKKALAVQRLANYQVDGPRFVVIGIAGVWNWRGTVGKVTGADGGRIDLKGPINDLNLVTWTGRQTLILFDTNVNTNEQVKWARAGLGKELRSRRAKVQFITPPENAGVNGIDDLLALWGPRRVLSLFENPTNLESLRIVLPPQFKQRTEGIFRVITKGEQLVETQLTNFCASIVTDRCLDDGIETKREFEIDAQLNGRPWRLRIPASRFAMMDWALEQIGPNAIIFPNQKDYARTAIQASSVTAQEQRIYTHTGWRTIDGRWCFLHAGGAVGQQGVVPGVQVQLPASISRYELRLPDTPEVLVVAVRASLLLIELGPPSITFPLMAAIIRAVLGESDFSVHVVGETGTFKSELAALAQQFFGTGMGRLHLPGSWSSTGNSLEILTFHAKDTLVVIDDFAPQGSAADLARYQAAADRIFRAAGNLAGRGRLDSTASLREPKAPRGLILSTGEDVPHGHSVRARLLILELSSGMIATEKLAICQQNAGSGRHSVAMGGFLQWLAGNYDDRLNAFRTRVIELRALRSRSELHARTPEMIASLQGALELWLSFCEACGAVDKNLRRTLAARAESALMEAGALQAKHQTVTEPAARFVGLIQSCLASGQAHLASRRGGEPDSPESCGWRRDRGDWSAQGRCIGWIDESDIYLQPAAAYQMAQVASRESGEALSISPSVLKQRLRDKGRLASRDVKRGTVTIRRMIAGSQKDVLHFYRSTLLPIEADEPDGSLEESQ